MPPPLAATYSYSLQTADYWVAPLSFTREHWTAPCDEQRVHLSHDANLRVVAQIQAGVRQLPSPSRWNPLVVFNASAGLVKLAFGPAGTTAALLVRLRRDRCLSADADPTAYCGDGQP